jgi:hypothetical protein
MRDVMKAADPAEVAHRWESAMEVAGTVEAALEGVSASVAAGMTAAVSSPVPSAAVSAAMAPASGRDGRGESRRNERAGDGGSDGHCSKHGAVSSVGHPPAAMLMPAAEWGLNAGSRLREPVIFWHCRRPCRGAVRSV